jgi:hypothetical protein
MPKLSSNGAADPVKLTTVRIGMIPHSLRDSLEKFPTIAGVERCRRAAQRGQTFGRQLEHHAHTPKFVKDGGSDIVHKG